MKLRYMIEYALRDRDTDPHYEPIGVWVQGPGPGLDIEMAYLPGNEDYQEEADWIINRLVENDIKTLPDDFLEYHQTTISPYRGIRSEVTDTNRFGTSSECLISTMHGIISSTSPSR
ncbi:MAG: hypothetical protein ACYC27_16135 [Armatimonadota bacterium]